MKKIRSKCLQAQDDTRALIAQKIPGPVGLTSSSSEFLNRASARNLISATVQKEADGAIARKALDALGKKHPCKGLFYRLSRCLPNSTRLVNWELSQPV